MTKANKTVLAVAWLMEEPGRTQVEAAKRFGISQAAVSYGLKTWRKQNPGKLGVDGRKGQKCKQH